jgi:Rrf2 family protein
MKLTVKSEYALLALVHIARQKTIKAVSAKAIAETMSIPPKFLEQILLSLKRGGFVTSIKGSQGGYYLAKPAKKINVGEIVRLFDGALAPTESVSKYFYRETPISKEKNLLRLFSKVRNYVSNLLEKTTINDLI